MLAAEVPVLFAAADVFQKVNYHRKQKKTTVREVHYLIEDCEGANKTARKWFQPRRRQSNRKHGPNLHQSKKVARSSFMAALRAKVLLALSILLVHYFCLYFSLGFCTCFLSQLVFVFALMCVPGVRVRFVLYLCGCSCFSFCVSAMLVEITFQICDRSQGSYIPLIVSYW